jgi:hypothetical protein
MSYRLNTRLKAFTAKSTQAISAALLSALDVRLRLAFDDAVENPRVAQRISNQLKNLATKNEQVKFQNEMRRLSAMALTPSERKDLITELNKKIEDRQALTRISKILNALDVKKFRRKTVRIMAWYLSRGYPSYRAYRRENKPRSRSQIDQYKMRMRVLASYGDKTAATALKRVTGLKDINSLLIPQRKWGYETGQFAKAIANGKFRLNQVQLRQVVSRYGALASAESTREQLASKIAVSLKDASLAQMASRASAALRQVIQEDNKFGFKVSVSMDFDIPNNEIGPMSNFIRAGFKGVNFPATNPELAAIALISALSKKTGGN